MTPCMGRTHGVHAEPTTLGLKFALWYAEMQRNLERMEHAHKITRVGKISGAVGTYANVDPFVASRWGWSRRRSAHRCSSATATPSC